MSPSLNHHGWTGTFDLNSVAFGTSPAYTLGVEHPSGEEYAFYLSTLVKTNGLHVRTHARVTAVRPVIGEAHKRSFEVDVTLLGKATHRKTQNTGHCTSYGQGDTSIRVQQMRRAFQAQSCAFKFKHT